MVVLLDEEDLGAVELELLAAHLPVSDWMDEVLLRFLAALFVMPSPTGDPPELKKGETPPLLGVLECVNGGDSRAAEGDVVAVAAAVVVVEPVGAVSGYSCMLDFDRLRCIKNLWAMGVEAWLWSVLASFEESLASIGAGRSTTCHDAR